MMFFGQKYGKIGGNGPPPSPKEQFVGIFSAQYSQDGLVGMLGGHDESIAAFYRTKIRPKMMFFDPKWGKMGGAVVFIISFLNLEHKHKTQKKGIEDRKGGRSFTKEYYIIGHIIRYSCQRRLVLRNLIYSKFLLVFLGVPCYFLA